MATEILRPIAPGDECNIPSQTGCSACPNHYTCVDEVVADGLTTDVKNYDYGYWRRDLYKLSKRPVGPKNKITAYAVCATASGVGNLAKCAIKTHGMVYEGNAEPVSISSNYSVWSEHSKEWANNPFTGAPWTKEEIDDLQAGASLYAKASYVHCTQVYVEVDPTLEGDGMPEEGAAIVTEGETYAVGLTVKNISTKVGKSVEAVLTIGISAGNELVTLITPQEKSEVFTPGETRSFEYDMVVPMGSGGQTVLITAWVEDPSGKNIASDYVELVIESVTPTALNLSFTNPKSSATTHWDARLYDIATNSWEASVLKQLGESCTLNPTSDTFLLCIGEQWEGMVYGPYLVIIPGLGYYTWDGKAEKLDGISTVNLPAQSNRSKIRGTLLEATWDGKGKIAVEESLPVSGYQNWGKFFIGDIIQTEEGTLLAAGTGVEAVVTMERTEYFYRWRLLSMVQYPPPPPPTYWFSATWRVEGVGIYYIRYVYTVTSNKSSFSVVAVIRDPTYGWGENNPIRGTTSTTGPVSEFRGPYGEGFTHECWCHPTVGLSSLPGDSAATARANGWVRVH